jgi:hypothetical protein
MTGICQGIAFVADFVRAAGLPEDSWFLENLGGGLIRVIVHFVISQKTKWLTSLRIGFMHGLKKPVKPYIQKKAGGFWGIVSAKKHF